VSDAPPIRAFLIDDEPLALKRLGRLLEATKRVVIVGRATDPAQGLAQLTGESVDVIFLDIHMPGLTGFEVVERLAPGANVVFTTAYDQHAVAAFEVNAVDYLLKPIERGRLNATLDRIASRRPDPAGADLRGTLERLASSLRGDAHLGHLASRIGGRVQLIPVDEVTHVFARDRATYAATPTAEFMLDAPLVELERKLDPAKFFRVHRATLVNLGWVHELHADVAGQLVIRLRGDERPELLVSRDRVRPLKERLGLT
jgi:two-component system, LytTR family, response regulator